MLKIFQNAFSKKKKSHTQSFQLESKDPPPIHKASTLDFQIVDEIAMNSIEESYNQKQRRSQSFEAKEQAPPQQEEFMDYVVQEDDSFFGISLKFSVNEGYLLRINNLSSDMIFQGQVLKVPVTNQPRFSIIKPIEQNKNAENIWEQDKLSQKFDVTYCNNKQNSNGIMTLTSDIVLFDPYQQEQTQDKQNKVRMNACISMIDINEAVTYVLQNQNGCLDYIVQILLSGIGKPKFEKQYFKQLRKYKKQKRSIATVFFRHAERDLDGKLYTEEIKKANCAFIVKFINEACTGYTEQSKLTKIPYLDIIEEIKEKKQIEIDEIQDVIGERMGKLWASLEYVPTLKEPSDCFTNTTYKQIIEQIPAVYRLADWIKYYNISQDGSSFQNLLYEIKDRAPIILIIKDFDNCVFGAYISTELRQYSQGFRGNGETFLFNYKNEFKSYFWTEKNRDFIYCDESGIGIGCGDKFGLFIDHSLTFGYSNQCDTFDNIRFSNSEKFRIMHLEVWAILQQ
ncbi:unnamed protein product (macronuclear) [Paramecium tetraurelia]|uniref:Oxidation resistance protein 1 n=1 Tax=Paramecium tetraurelia TaxID=5888 RepID=A0DM75_PARTE|nr:uncharacterized protein GSPATT00018360001 [Paramecium tetraurelia]CAK84142.1 unnamed protein product [Paramecium tetraurelia]|eukprot:XP_001451539.1 hypothetical protein (macronuclear) [Paramecium tetraurelia strain d4-2]